MKLTNVPSAAKFLVVKVLDLFSFMMIYLLFRNLFRTMIKPFNLQVVMKDIVECIKIKNPINVAIVQKPSEKLARKLFMKEFIQVQNLTRVINVTKALELRLSGLFIKDLILM